MSEHEILFSFPKAGVLSLISLFFLMGAYALRKYRQRQEKAYAPLSLLERLLTPRSLILSRTKMIGWMLIWSLACFALMGPFGNLRYSPLTAHPSLSSVPVRPHEILFLVDTSASMGVADGAQNQTRLEHAKIIMEDIIRQLQGEMVSLYAFTSQLTPLVPSTLDYLFMQLAIKELHLDEGDVGGTDFAAILSDLKQEILPQPSSKSYTLIMLTDGGDNLLEIKEGTSLARERILNALPNPQEFHFRLLTIGIGGLKPQPIPNVLFEGKAVFSQLHPKILKELAAKTRGIYYQATEWTSWDLAQEILKQIKEDLDATIQEKKVERKVVDINKEEMIVDLYYQFPLGLAIFFYCLNLLLPDVRFLSPHAHAHKTS